MLSYPTHAIIHKYVTKEFLQVTIWNWVTTTEIWTHISLRIKHQLLPLAIVFCGTLTPNQPKPFDQLLGL